MMKEPNSLLKLAEATTIRYNSNFKTDRALVESLNKKIIEWITLLKGQ